MLWLGPPVQLSHVRTCTHPNTCPHMDISTYIHTYRHVPKCVHPHTQHVFIHIFRHVLCIYNVHGVLLWCGAFHRLWVTKCQEIKITMLIQSLPVAYVAAGYSTFICVIGQEVFLQGSSKAIFGLIFHVF